jgi:hypothetical protein
MGLEEFGPEQEAPKPLLAARKRLIKQEQKTKPKRRKRRGSKAVKAARTAPARAVLTQKRAAVPRKVTLTLTMPHWINGISYGPGTVTVTSDLATVFHENERRVRQNDADMFGSGKATFIGPGGLRVPVPYGSMDHPNLAMIEAFSL